MSQSMAQEPQQGDVLKIQAKPDWKSKFMTPKNIFTGVGCVLLTLLAMVPIWNAAILLQDSNYVFWAGRRTPTWLIGICVAIIFAYVFTVAMFFRKAGQGASSTQIEQTIMMVANIFITLFGLFLMLASLPITHQADLTYTNLVYRCGTAEQTHRLYEYSQVLQNIRATPECAKKYSVEECEGYEEAAPYTTFLKGMEASFRCAGFCTPQPVVTGVAAPSPAPGPGPAAAPAPAAAMISVKKNMRQHSLATEAIEQHSVVSNPIANAQYYPPTLFSDYNFQASCEGMAARDMKNFAGAIGQQTFYQGVYLVAIAVMTGFLKLLGFCMNKS